MTTLQLTASSGVTDKIWNYLTWGIVVAAVALAILMPLAGRGAPMIAAVMAIAFAVIHGVRRYGWKAFLVFSWSPSS